MAFAWWSRLTTWRHGARPRAARRPALQVEQLGERALLSGLAPAGAEQSLVRGLLADLTNQGPGVGTAGLLVVLGDSPSGERPGAGPAPLFEFDLKPGGALLVSPVAVPAGASASPVRPGGESPDRTYLVLIPSNELPTSGQVVARLEQEATRSFFDPSGQALVLELPRPPFRPDERNRAFAPLLDSLPRGPTDRDPKGPSPAAWGEEGAAQAPADGAGVLNVAGLVGQQLPQAWANASEGLPEGVAWEVEGDGVAEWAMPESAGTAVLQVPAGGPGPAWVELVPLGDNSLSVVPALLAPPAGVAPPGEVGVTEGASGAPDGGAHLAPPGARGEPGSADPEGKAPPDAAQATPASLAPEGAAPVPERGLSSVRDLLRRLVTEREGSSPSEPVLDALFIVGLWGAGAERLRKPARRKAPRPWGG
jgi:hypothetical protein